MNSLYHIIRDSSNYDLIHCEDGVITSSEVTNRIEKLRGSELTELRGKRVSLRNENTSDYVVLLCALQDWVDTLVLIEGNGDEQILQELEDKADVDYRIRAQSSNQLNIEKLSKSSSITKLNSNTSIVIPTSGTTDTPKLISHDLSSLTKSLKHANDFSRKLKWGLLYDVTRFAGIQVLLQAIFGESGLICSKDHRDTEKVLVNLEHHHCNALSATPSLWRKLALLGKLAKLKLKIVTLGGESVDQKILDILKNVYPDATIRHIYASTEAGVGFAVVDGLAGFPKGYTIEPPKGISLKVREDGMLMLKPAEIKQTMIAENTSLVDDEGWIESGDLLTEEGDRYLFLGRSNGAINVGGQKVHPTKVESCIYSVSGVEGVRVYAKPNPIIGNLVLADIVVASGFCQKEVLAEVKAACRAQLEKFERPAMLKPTKEIELSVTGKIKR